MKIGQAGSRPPEIIIGIDPDADKNGVATLITQSRHIDATALTFPETLEYIRYTFQQAQRSTIRLIVAIEGGWLNKAHWHIGYNDSREAAAAKGNAVGRNHETGRKISEMCSYWNIPYEIVRPLPLKVGKIQLWKGKDGKISSKELSAITGIRPQRLNQEARDAALIAWVFAGFPLNHSAGNRLL